MRTPPCSGAQPSARGRGDSPGDSPPYESATRPSRDRNARVLERAAQHERVRGRLGDLALGRIAGDLRRVETFETGRGHLRAPVVVEHRVDRLRLAGELAQRLDPLLELLGRVEVVEPLGG